MLAEKLTDFQRVFAEHYAIDLDREKAVRAAGYEGIYPSQRAYELLQMQPVAEYVEYLKSQQTYRTQINADYVLKNIIEVVQRCQQEVEPLRDRSGNHIEIVNKAGEMAKAYTFDARGALKGLELIGKHLAMFTDTVEQRVTFTQMGEVVVGNPATGETKALEFDVGSEPNNAAK